MLKNLCVKGRITREYLKDYKREIKKEK